MTTSTTVVAEKNHATLGASSASRWMNCPGSVRLSAGIPNTSSEFAQEGTAAHALAELSLRNSCDPDVYVGTTLEGVEVSEDMADFVRIFVEYCRRQVLDAQPFAASSPTADGYYWIERKFNLAQLNPPTSMFGTADFVIYDERTRTLEVVDLKYGAGVVVEVKGNPQLRYYALGAALSLQGLPIEQVKITIVQPRVTHPDGIIRSEVLDYLEIVGFAGDLLDAARRTQTPDAPLKAGDHCRWCLARGVCPEQKSQALAVAQAEFGGLEEVMPPIPELIPDDQFAEMMQKLPILDDWIKAMRARALAELESGKEVAGLKLVAKRANRKWKDEEETAQWLRGKGNVDEEIYEMKLKSPAKIEKLVGKKNLPEDLWEKQSSGYTMVAAHDARPAVQVTRGEEFDLLPAGTEIEE